MVVDRLYNITILRFIALFFVSIAHFVSVTTWGRDVPGVINGILDEPMLSSTTHILWKVEAYIYQHFKLQFGIIGVVIFFLISGYFIPELQAKYNRLALSETTTKTIPHLLFTRLKKLYPTVFIAVLLNGILVYITENIHYNWYDYLGTATLGGGDFN